MPPDRDDPTMPPGEPQTPAESEDHLPTDPVERLLASCLNPPSGSVETAVERACREHPQHAVDLRRRWDRLRAIGWVSDPAPFDLPERLGEFRLESCLGGGGMGIVFRAWQESLSRHVALKVVRPGQVYFPGSRERFRREVEALTRLKHPAILPVYAAGEHLGLPYFVMELVDGTSLETVLGRLQGEAVSRLTGRDLQRVLLQGMDPPAEPAEPWPTERLAEGWTDLCVRMALTVAQALQHAHERGVIHRDVKPSNIMLTTSGRVLLVDFGLASVYEGSHRLTQSGTAVGSLPYMAPEQIRGDGARIDARTDVYGLGVTLWEALALRSPFLGGTPEATRHAIATAKLEPLSHRNRAVSWDLQTVCAKAMDPDPERRYASAADFARDLTNLLARRSIEARRPHVVLRARRYAQRHPTRVASAALSFVLLPALGILAGFLIARRPLVEEGLAKRREDAVERLLAQGWLQRQVDPLRARAAFDEALSLDPANDEAAVGRLLVDLSAGDDLAARAFLASHAWATGERRALFGALVDAPTLDGLAAHDALEHFVLGSRRLALAVQANDEAEVDRAFRQLDAAVLLAPVARPSFHVERARALSMLPARGEQARQAADVLLHHWPADLACRWIAAVCLVRQPDARDRTRARELLEQVVAEEPGLHRARGALACALTVLGETDAALAAFRAALDGDPEDAETWGQHGQVLAERGELEPAHAATRRSIELAPADATHRLRHALVCSRLEREDEALAVAVEGLQQHPQHVRLHERRIASLDRLGRTDELRDALEEMHHLLPDEPRTHLLRAHLLPRLGDEPGGLEALRRAVRLEGPKAPLELLVRLADREARVGDASASRLLVDQVLARLANGERLDSPPHLQRLRELRAAAQERDG